MIASGAIKNGDIDDRISRGAMTPSRPIRLCAKIFSEVIGGNNRMT